jgi:putative SOS response-associated peptidase YedK
MMAEIHTRMPVVIKPEDFNRWLDHSRPDGKQVTDLMRPVEDSFFVAAETKLPSRKPKPPDAKPEPEKQADDQLRLL